MRKKGITPAIAWVLMIGLGVALGTFVVSWSLRHTETITGEQLDAVEGGIECNDVNVLVSFGKDLVDNKCNITIHNSGMKAIDQIDMSYKYYSVTEVTSPAAPIELASPIKPREKVTKKFDFTGDLLSVQLTPYVKVGEKKFICRNDKAYAPFQGTLQGCV